MNNCNVCFEDTQTYKCDTCTAEICSKCIFKVLDNDNNLRCIICKNFFRNGLKLFTSKKLDRKLKILKSKRNQSLRKLRTTGILTIYNIECIGIESQKQHYIDKYMNDLETHRYQYFKKINDSNITI
jgi:hypothetical protein